jgi:DNA-directed RNA polymerase subunit RPC12/RpoP
MMTEFKCVFCGNNAFIDLGVVHREENSCPNCGSSVRQRTVAHIVNKLLEFWPNKRTVNVVGLSDAPVLAEYLKKLPRVNYLNTFLDENPKLDIEDPPKSMIGEVDILISSDVLEHVMFPVSKSLVGSARLLSRRGVLILTVPYQVVGPSIEHYPWMVTYKVELETSPPQVTGFDQSGNQFSISNPIFHGGPGNTLEMRHLNLSVILDELSKAGFHSVEHFYHSIPDLGIVPANGMGAVIGFRKKVTNIDWAHHMSPKSALNI